MRFAYRLRVSAVYPIFLRQNANYSHAEPVTANQRRKNARKANDRSCNLAKSGKRLTAGVSCAEQWRWGSLWRWWQTPEPHPPLLSAWPIPRLPGWVNRVNEPLTDGELQSVRESAQRGRAFGDADSVESSVNRLGLHSNFRPRDRPKAAAKCEDAYIES